MLWPQGLTAYPMEGAERKEEQAKNEYDLSIRRTEKRKGSSPLC
jgi:hypothetical protein